MIIVYVGAPICLFFQPLVDFVTGGRFFVRVLPRDLLSVACYPLPIQMKMCQIPELVLAGFSYHHSDPETLPISLLQTADLISSKTLSHLIQLYSSGKFQSYDYGAYENEMKYNQPEPPSYDLSKMKIPTYFIRAENDMVITKENVEYLYNSLPAEVRPDYIHVIRDEYFNHSDFLTANNVVALLYNHIVKILKDRGL
uniref:AB hydrolase-1 domain-containing protein n=1 Tax=Photinus pyralis TaxID=7054 RepID=A0A1Y1KSV4_PHOPY